MLPLDKLSDKLLRFNAESRCLSKWCIISLGLPSSLMDSASGNKWAILQQSERANSRVAGFYGRY